MDIILGGELIGLYLLWRLGLWRRLVNGLDAALTRIAHGQPGTAKRMAQSMVRAADYLELTRGTRVTPGTFWLIYLIGSVIVSELLAGSNGDTPRLFLSFFLI